MQVPFIRINSAKSDKTDVVIKESSNKISVQLKYGDFSVDLRDISKTWFRRGLLYLCDYDTFIPTLPELDQFIENESNTIKGFLYNRMSANENINNPAMYNCNKLHALYTAVQAGLNIPNTIISRKDLILKILLLKMKSVSRKAFKIFMRNKKRIDMYS